MAAPVETKQIIVRPIRVTRFVCVSNYLLLHFKVMIFSLSLSLSRKMNRNEKNRIFTLLETLNGYLCEEERMHGFVDAITCDLRFFVDKENFFVRKNKL